MSLYLKPLAQVFKEAGVGDAGGSNGRSGNAERRLFPLECLWVVAEGLSSVHLSLRLSTADEPGPASAAIRQPEWFTAKSPSPSRRLHPASGSLLRFIATVGASSIWRRVHLGRVGCHDARNSGTLVASDVPTSGWLLHDLCQQVARLGIRGSWFEAAKSYT